MTTPISTTDSRRHFHPLPPERLTRLEGWAMRAHSMGYVYQPSTIEGIRDVLEVARKSGRSLAPRGSGYSYGDTALNSENIVLELRRMNRVLDWDPAMGVIRAEPGVTIGQLWRRVLKDGWWPAVVPGTMHPTLGGCASTNVHGKNNWRVGCFGDYILSAEVLLPSGEVVSCSREDNSDIFFAAVGGLGMLGVFISLTLHLEQVQTGLVRVVEHAAHSLREMFAIFEQNSAEAEHLIGWIDAFPRGRTLGRGLVQVANVVDDGPGPAGTLMPDRQDLGDRVLGIVPRSVLWRGMKLASSRMGMQTLNATRFQLGSIRSGTITNKPHAQFHFMLDYVPNFKWAFRPGGILQYQVFVSQANALSVFESLLERSQHAGYVPHLAVLKRHRRDTFLLNYSVDGYSLALDYHVAPRHEHRLREMLENFTNTVALPAGGRFYPAKDSFLSQEGYRQSLTPHAIDEYLGIKRHLDPEQVFQSDQYRRVFGSLAAW